jgi:hypothetical protein
MNNWDKRPSIEVYAGNVAMPFITSILEERTDNEPKIFEVDGEYYSVIAINGDIRGTTIMGALVHLHKKLNTSKLNDWAEIVGDLLVSKIDDLWVTEWYGTTKAPIIDVKVTYYEA